MITIGTKKFREIIREDLDRSSASSEQFVDSSRSAKLVFDIPRMTNEYSGSRRYSPVV
jgi:hypothetical protein